MPKNMYIFFALSLLVSSNALKSELLESALEVADTTHHAADTAKESAKAETEANDAAAQTAEAKNTQATEEAVVQAEEEVVTTPITPVAADNKAATDAQLNDLLVDADFDDSDDEM